MYICYAAVIMMLAVFCGSSFADDISSDDNFFKSTISSVVDKVSEYTSGEKKLLASDDDGSSRTSDYGRNSLDRKLSEPVKIRTRISPSQPKSDNDAGL